MSYTKAMGLFWNFGKKKAASSAAPHQETAKKEKSTNPALPSAESKTQLHPGQHPHHAHHPHPVEQKAAPVDHTKTHIEIEMRKFVFRLSSHDNEKCNAFVKEMIRRVNGHYWHDLVGRIGKHSDGIKVRIDVKGKHGDIQNFIAWCKVGYLGVHAIEVTETKVHSMSYSGYPPFKEQLTSWPTA